MKKTALILIIFMVGCHDKQPTVFDFNHSSFSLKPPRYTANSEDSFYMIGFDQFRQRYIMVKQAGGYADTFICLPVRFLKTEK
jgi:hypothetical protein